MLGKAVKDLGTFTTFSNDGLFDNILQYRSRRIEVIKNNEKHPYLHIEGTAVSLNAATQVVEQLPFDGEIKIGNAFRADLLELQSTTVVKLLSDLQDKVSAAHQISLDQASKFDNVSDH